MFFYEKRIAEITSDKIELQNPVQTYNIVKISELKIIASSVSIVNDIVYGNITDME